MFKKILIIIGLSVFPIVEQRGAIPWGISLGHLNPFLVFLISFLGSLLSIPFVFFLFDKIYAWIQKRKWLNWLSNIIDNKIRKNVAKFEKYEELALIIFVGIPLPTTGLWAGTAIASFLGLKFKKTFICCALGGLISAALITAGWYFFQAVLFPGGFHLPSYLKFIEGV